jgi:hypothetical protein
MRKRGYPQVARYHKARGDKKDEYYLQQLQLYVPHRAEDIPDWEENPGVFYVEEEQRIRRVSSIVMEHLSAVEEARSMVQNLDTPADLTEIGLDVDPTGEQENEEARGEGDHQDEELEVLNPNQYNITKEVDKQGSLFRKIVLPPKEEMHKKFRNLDKYQQMTAELCIRHARDIIKAEKGNRPPEQILLVVSGGAGSGKSTLIECLEIWVNYILSGLESGESGHTTDQPLLIKCAFTGAAADNIGGNTLTRTFGLSYDGKHTSLGDRERDAKRELFSKVSPIDNMAFHAFHPQVKFVIIDEFSMVSSAMLYQIDRKLQELKQSGKPFGGVSILFLGDPMQLKPVPTTSPPTIDAIVSGMRQLHLDATKPRGTQYTVRSQKF